MKSYASIVALVLIGVVAAADEKQQPHMVGSSYGGSSGGSSSYGGSSGSSPSYGGSSGGSSYGGSSGGSSYGGSSGGSASIPAPPCPKNYIISCQPSLAPAPCAPSSSSGYGSSGSSGAYSEHYPVYAVPHPVPYYGFY